MYDNSFIVIIDFLPMVAYRKRLHRKCNPSSQNATLHPNATRIKNCVIIHIRTKVMIPKVLQLSFFLYLECIVAQGFEIPYFKKSVLLSLKKAVFSDIIFNVSDKQLLTS